LILYSFLWQTPDTRTNQTGRLPLKGIFEIKPPLLQASSSGTPTRPDEEAARKGKSALTIDFA